MIRYDFDLHITYRNCDAKVGEKIGKSFQDSLRCVSVIDECIRVINCPRRHPNQDESEDVVE